MIGEAAKLELADFINAGAKTAEKIAKAKGVRTALDFWRERSGSVGLTEGDDPYYDLIY
jgi:hypothetical protein